jgi:hypothetical protein
MKLDRQAPSIASRTKAAQKAVLVLEDGTVFRGRGLGAFGQALGEVCFNTSMTGYQEILTDPSYAGQIITHVPAHRERGYQRRGRRVASSDMPRRRSARRHYSPSSWPALWRLPGCWRKQAKPAPSRGASRPISRSPNSAPSR